MMGSITIGTYIIDYRLNEFNDVSIKKIDLIGFHKQAFLLYLSEQIKKEKYYINFFVLKQICLDYDVFNMEAWVKTIKKSFLSNNLTPRVIIKFMNLDGFSDDELEYFLIKNPKAYHKILNSYDKDEEYFRTKYLKEFFELELLKKEKERLEKYYIYQLTQEDYINNFLIETGALIDDSDAYLLSFGVDPKDTKDYICNYCKTKVKLYKCIDYNFTKNKGRECCECGHNIYE